VAPARAPETIGGATISEAENRVRIVFPCVPPESVRKELKGSAFIGHALSERGNG